MFTVFFRCRKTQQKMIHIICRRSENKRNTHRSRTTTLIWIIIVVMHCRLSYVFHSARSWAVCTFVGRLLFLSQDCMLRYGRCSHWSERDTHTQNAKRTQHRQEIVQVKRSQAWKYSTRIEINMKCPRVITKCIRSARYTYQCQT